MNAYQVVEGINTRISQENLWHDLEQEILVINDKGEVFHIEAIKVSGDPETEGQIVLLIK